MVRQVVEAGLGHLPFTERTVTTPTGEQYVGVDFAKRLCGVSIIRSGESMENALRACCKGIKIGKILVYRCGGRARTCVPMPVCPAHDVRLTYAACTVWARKVHQVIFTLLPFWTAPTT